MMKLQRRKAESLLCLLLVLTSVFVAVSFLPRVKAATTIILMTPVAGNVGTTIYLTANITSANGTFQILWDDRVIIPNATAVGNDVNASFTVPPTTSGTHVVALVDVAQGENATGSFSVSTAYSVDVLPQLVSPTQMQEGDAFQVFLNMTGGEQGKTNVANITVTVPNGASYTSLGNISTENDGNGTLIVNYPGDFTAGANTNFTGQYSIFFNDTVASKTFNVGLTNSSEYHRDQTVDVKAVYRPGEDVNMAITGMDLNYSTNLTADTAGIVHYVNSTMLSNASIGVYMVNITSVSGPTTKDPPDVQSFSVPGLAVGIVTRNLASEPVGNVAVSIFENLKSVANLTSSTAGLLNLTLERGSYVCNASYRDQAVGGLTMEVNETSTSFDLYCNFTNLMVVVADEDGVLIPDVELSLAEENQTSTISVDPTDVNGSSIIHSLLPLLNGISINYDLNASRYGMQFNITVGLQLPVAAEYVVRIICPKMNLQVNVTDGNLQPISHANVTAAELKGGLIYSGITSASGNVTLRCTFGRYQVGAYAGGIKLNETTVDLNDTTVSTTIICELYGLNISVRVVDYFGQSIPNLNVTLQRSGFQSSGVSGSDGLIAFNGIVGGDLQLTVRFVGQSDATAIVPASFDNSTTIEIRLDRYVMLAGMLVETGQFATVIMIVLIVVVILFLEIFRRRRTKAKTE